MKWQKTGKTASFFMFLLVFYATPAQAFEVINIANEGATDLLLTGATAYRSGTLGTSLTTGDFNGDGKTDLALGAPGMSSPKGITRAGNIYIFFGDKSVNDLPQEVTTQDGSEDAMLYGVEMSERAGDLLASGDFNNDGFSDLILSDKVSNQFHVLMGQAQNWDVSLDLATDTNIVLAHSQDSSLFNSAFFPLYNQSEIAGVAAGNLNGDGIDDLALGVPNETANGLTNAGRSWIGKSCMTTCASHVFTCLDRRRVTPR